MKMKNTLTNEEKISLKTRYDDMIRRCYYKKCKNYKYYGARGIKVCDEWLGVKGRKNFYNWAIQNGFEKKLSLDKINNNGNYSPSNCRWTTKRIQNINKRNKINEKAHFIGIFKHSSGDRWYGQLRGENGERYYTGSSKDIIIAAIMRNNFIIDNNLDNNLNDLTQYKEKYDMEMRYEPKRKKNFIS